MNKFSIMLKPGCYIYLYILFLYRKTLFGILRDKCLNDLKLNPRQTAWLKGNIDYRLQPNIYLQNMKRIFITIMESKSFIYVDYTTILTDIVSWLN